MLKRYLIAGALIMILSGCGQLLRVPALEAQSQVTSPQPVDTYSGKPRLAVISDIGGDPDDQMSLVRLLRYSNELDIEAMIDAKSTFHRTSIHPEVMHAVIHGYG